MRHFGKRAFALILALMLCLTLFPSSLAEDAGRITATEDAPEQEVTIVPAEEGTIAPADEGCIRPAEEGDALPRTDETQGVASGQCGDNLIWVLSDDGVLTISGTGDMWGCNMNEYAWSGAPWQDTLSNITSIRIEPGVTDIGEGAFYCCWNATDITIPETVTKIGKGAFLSCSSLLYLTIPEGVTSIGEYALESCHGLKTLWLPASLSEISGDLINSCAGLTDVYFGGTKAEWMDLGAIYDPYKVAIHCADGDMDPADAACCGDNLLWSLDDDGLLTISGSGDMWDFDYETVPWSSRSVEIKQVWIASGVTSIGSYAFYSCTKLSSLTLPASISRIGESQFSRCTSLTDIYYGGTMTGWKDLESDYDRFKVTVHCSDGELSPADLDYCGDNLVWSLSSDGTLTIAGSGDMWDFSNGQAPWYSKCREIKQLRIMSGVTSIGNRAFMFCNQLSSVTLPEGLTRVGNSAFCNCRSLWALTLPETVTSIGSSAFSDSSIYSFVIPEGVISIENSTFDSCTELTGVIIPDTVTEIGATAFYKCWSLSDVALPEGLASIGGAAFCDCSSLESIEIPASVNRIEIGAFRGSALKTIRFRGHAPLFVRDNAAQHQFVGVTATAFYPAGDPSWTAEVRQNYGGAITWEPYLPTGGTLRLGDATACAGKAFTLDLTLDENPGVTVLSFELDYDASLMEFEGIQEGVLTGWTVNVKKNALVWDSEQDRTDTGTLLRLKFRLKEDAVPGETSIGIKNHFAGNYQEETLVFQTEPGNVTILLHRPGDANGDGAVNGHDLTRLRKYLAGAEKEIIAGNADVNADDLVDILDLIRLRKYLALDDVILE